MKKHPHLILYFDFALTLHFQSLARTCLFRAVATSIYLVRKSV